MSQATNEAVLAAAEAENREFLVFSLGDEEYAIDILKVQEIRGYENVTRIANAPDFIKGVTNLRGVIVHKGAASHGTHKHATCKKDP